ncbi:MAG: hypothetical protein ACKPHU_20580, partial [Planctomycetaceae bacterium]
AASRDANCLQSPRPFTAILRRNKRQRAELGLESPSYGNRIPADYRPRLAHRPLTTDLLRFASRLRGFA